MSVADRSGERAPGHRLLDARDASLDERGLRERARALSKRSGARWTSRSYRFPLALVAWHCAPVGVDIERVEPWDEATADSIRTPAERAAGWPPDDADRVFSSLWSSKEALSKALGDALAYDPRRLAAPTAWPDGRSGPWRAAPIDVGAGHVAWLCWRLTPGA